MAEETMLLLCETSMIDVCKYGFPMQVLSSDKFDLHSTVYLACFTEKKWIKLCVFRCFGKTSKRETVHWWLKHFNRIWSTGGAHIKVCHVPKFWAPSWFLQKSVIKNVVHFPSSELSQNQHASPLFWAPSWPLLLCLPVLWSLFCCFQIPGLWLLPVATIID